MLTQAITQTLDSICRNGFNVLLPDTPAVPVGIVDPKPLPTGYRCHNHNYIELVQLVEGKSRLKTSGKTIRMNDHDCWLIQPQAVHGETYATPHQSYKLLWIVFTHMGVNFFLSTYTFKDGFIVQMERLYCLIDQLESLWEQAARKDINENRLVRAKFQSLMIQALLTGLSQIELQCSDQIDHQKVLIGQIRQHIEHHFREDISIDELAQMARCTPNYLNGLFRKFLGQPIHQYILQKRLDTAKRLLTDHHIPIKEIAYELGFNDPLYFSRIFRKRFGISPTHFGTSVVYSCPKKRHDVT
jgi:AraC-like DNA-binding protein